MTSYLMKSLAEVNPCGVEDRPETHCRYIVECTDLGKRGVFICLSFTGFHTANYLMQGSTSEQEEIDLKEFLGKDLSKAVIDPEKESWSTAAMKPEGVETYAKDIINRAQLLKSKAESCDVHRN